MIPSQSVCANLMGGLVMLDIASEKAITHRMQQDACEQLILTLGFLTAYLADQIRSYGKTNGRISYVIHQEKIASAILGWRWRKYKGINKHNHHIHVSFKKNQDKNSEFFNIPLLGGNA
jgi:hypothetical protein